MSTFRETYRAEQIGPHYNGYLHFFSSVGLTSGIAVLCIATLQRPSALQWLVLPIGLIISNLIEYVSHRFPMHHPMQPRFVYERHALQHHRFFTHDAMIADSVNDFHMILFPTAGLIVFLIVVDGSMGAAVYWLFGANIAKLFIATTVGYYAAYESLHTAYHLPHDHWVSKIPGLKHMRALHTSHHNLRNMTKYNFNVTMPLSDLLFGTYKRE